MPRSAHYFSVPSTGWALARELAHYWNSKRPASASMRAEPTSSGVSCTLNCRLTSPKSKAWGYLLELDQDVAVLQDFGTIPESVPRLYSYDRGTAVTGTGRSQPSAAGVLVKGTMDADVPQPHCSALPSQRSR